MVYRTVHLAVVLLLVGTLAAQDQGNRMPRPATLPVASEENWTVKRFKLERTISIYDTGRRNDKITLDFREPLTIALRASSSIFSASPSALIVETFPVRSGRGYTKGSIYSIHARNSLRNHRRFIPRTDAPRPGHARQGFLPRRWLA